MLERKLDVECENLILEDAEVFNHCNRELRLGLYSLPEGGSLHVDLARVLCADEAYFFDTVAMIQGTNGGLLQSKHLLLLNPRPRVLEALINAVDMAAECFMYMDEEGVIRPKGKALSATLLRAFQEILIADEQNIMLAAADLQKRLNVSVQVCAESLRRLFNWGFINRKEEPGSRGRPSVKYYAYWPRDFRFWPTEEIAWEIPAADKKSRPIMIHHNRNIETSREAV